MTIKFSSLFYFMIGGWIAGFGLMGVEVNMLRELTFMSLLLLAIYIAKRAGFLEGS